jgi:hypothetical protein
MSILKKLFSKSNPSIATWEKIRFGRYTDSYKTPEQYKLWAEAIREFEDNQFSSSFRKFFGYLENPGLGNLEFEEVSGGQKFSIIQGSKIVRGTIDHKSIRAEVCIAEGENLNIGLLRRLIERNGAMEYSKFALNDEGKIFIVWNSYILDASPYKLYYALKEMATNADKQDDLLLDEFSELNWTDEEIKEEITQDEKNLKIGFLKAQIYSTFNFVKLNPINFTKYPGAISYLYLDLIYRFDYLIRPEGFCLEQIEKGHREFFTGKEKTVQVKNDILENCLDEINGRNPEQISLELYRTKSTFGVTTPTSSDQFIQMINLELGNMDWYIEQGHGFIALSIPNYIVGFCLFNYAFPAALNDFLEFYFQVIDDSYFQGLGFPIRLLNNDVPHKKHIEDALIKIRNEHIENFPQIDLDFQVLDYSDLVLWAKTYLQMLSLVDFSKKLPE